MKYILLILAVSSLAATALHAQVLPGTIPPGLVPGVDPAMQAAVEAAVPAKYAGYTSLFLIFCLIGGRVWQALISNGGLLGIWNAVIRGIPPSAPKLLIACLALLTISSCSMMQKLGATLSTPKARQIEVGLAKIGLVGAVVSDVLSPGDALTIARGVATLTSADDGTTKVLALTKLGLDTAFADGVIKPGDVVTIKETTALITSALPAVELTSGK